MIRSKNLKVASHTTDAIGGLRVPTNLTELQSFLGICNVLRKIVPNVLRPAAPLNKKILKYYPKTFGPLNDNENQPRKALREALMSPPELQLQNATGHITLDTDACTFQV